MKKTITLEDIRKAIELIKEDTPPNKTREYFWGWLETDYIGNPITIKFKRNQIKELKKICGDNFRYGRKTKYEPFTKNTKIESLWGIKVLNTIKLK